ncbi:MAG: hypothetical protein H6971_05545 [Gammaproteobacteria bacterium]|nr:hypothetical protein [Gammaproteobacteria bacterium]
MRASALASADHLLTVAEAALLVALRNPVPSAPGSLSSQARARDKVLGAGAWACCPNAKFREARQEALPLTVALYRSPLTWRTRLRADPTSRVSHLYRGALQQTLGRWSVSNPRFL